VIGGDGTPDTLHSNHRDDTAQRFELLRDVREVDESPDTLRIITR
jgi:hypothetical protein